MILAIIAGSLLAVVGLFIFAKAIWQYVIAVIFAVIFMGSIALMTLNYTHHFGMKETNVVTKQKLYNTAETDIVNLLLYQPLGDGSEKVYLYKTEAQQKKVTATKTDQVTNTVKTNQATAQLVTTTKRWVYRSDWYRFLFGIADNNHEYISQVNTFEIPTDWSVLSVAQAKAFGQLMKERKDSLAAEGKVYVTKQVTEAMMKNPKLSPAEQGELVKKATATYQAQAIAAALAEVQKGN